MKPLLEKCFIYENKLGNHVLFKFNDVIEALRDYKKYLEYINSYEHKVKDKISKYFKKKYSISLFANDSNQVFNTIFGEFRQ